MLSLLHVPNDLVTQNSTQNELVTIHSYFLKDIKNDQKRNVESVSWNDVSEILVLLITYEIVNVLNKHVIILRKSKSTFF